MNVIGDHRRRAANQRDRGQYGLIFFFTLSISMVVFSLYGAQASVFQKARATVLDFFEPVLSVFAGPAHWVNGRASDVGEFFRLHDELDRLRDENEALRQYQDEVRQLRREVAYYTAMTDVELPPAQRFVDARVIGESAGPFSRSLIVSAGTNSQVFDGSAVVDDAGLLGYVSLAGRRAARVVPLTDANSRIPVVILAADGSGREVNQALLTGRSAGAPVLDVFAQRLEQPPVPGQRIVTSGAGGMMPRGIPIGEVSTIDGDKVAVRLDANTATPHLVRVIDFRFPEPDDAEAGDNDTD